jgi:hypothetical protein
VKVISTISNDISKVEAGRRILMEPKRSSEADYLTISFKPT